MIAFNGNDPLVEVRGRHIEKMEAVAQLANGISRDIADLVEAAGATVLDVLAELGPRDPAYGRLDEVRDSMQRVLSVTRQVQSIAREQLQRPATVDMRVVVARMLPTLQRLGGPFVTVSHVADGAACALADFGQVEQIVVNLVVNARDAMPLGGVLRIVTECRANEIAMPHRHGVLPAGEWAVLEVHDSGTGIAPDVIGRLFEPFFTTKLPGQGSGLGLSTVYGIARQAGGQVMVHSESERGTTVTVALPACTEPRASELDASDDAGAILVVDEDEWVRTVITRVLRRAGYGVLEADSAASAVATLHGVAGRCVRLVLADAIAAGAPRVGLTDVIEQQHPDTRLLLMTARTAGTFDPPPGASLRDRVLVKPFTPAELLGAVRLQLS